MVPYLLFEMAFLQAHPHRTFFCDWSIIQSSMDPSRMALLGALAFEVQDVMPGAFRLILLLTKAGYVLGKTHQYFDILRQTGCLLQGIDSMFQAGWFSMHTVAACLLCNIAWPGTCPCC